MAEFIYLVMTANDESWGTTSPVYGGHRYLSPASETLEAFPLSGYYFVEWDGPVNDVLANPTTIDFENDVTVTAIFGEDIELNTGDSYSQRRLDDQAGLLLQGHVETLSGDNYGEYADTGFAYWSPAQLLRGPHIPADPYYDHDGDPATEEMLMYEQLSGFLEEIGTNLYPDSIASWNQKTFSQKLRWIQEYDP
jgi:hypothetical protein